MSDSLFPVDAPAAGAQPAAPAYRVLARKYRPQRFEDLIGQEPMVRTLANSFAAGRIHQAYILTGVRGVGKTTTARILARAFNYHVPGRIDAPSVDMPELGVHCQAIMESRHVDVIEMDAASHTGIDDVREIIENARYRPVSARTKVYIVDEVHMLSKQAFNGLLKTLEEPPEHVRFLFATTEIEKVPITVRSRCIRFDLKRIDAGPMIAHLAKISAAEGVAVEPDALALIARVAEGSVRDALSLLDQGIAYGGPGGLTAAAVREMLGLADRGEVIVLFERAMKGEIAGALELVRALYHAGADPADILIELAEFCHFVTGIEDRAGRPRRPGDRRERTRARARIRRQTDARRADPGLADPAQGRRGPEGFAASACVRRNGADPPGLRLRPADAGGGFAQARRRRPRGARDTPRRCLRSAAGRAPRSASRRPIPPRRTRPAAPVPAPTKAAEPRAAIRLARFEDVVALARTKRDIQLVQALEQDARVERFEQGSIAFSLVEGASPGLAQNLARRLQEWTGERWMVALAPGSTAPTLRERRDAREAERMSGAQAHPLVRKVLERFKGARVIDVRTPDSAASAPPPHAQVDDDVGYSDLEPLGDDDL